MHNPLFVVFNRHKSNILSNNLLLRSWYINHVDNYFKWTIFLYPLIKSLFFSSKMYSVYRSHWPSFPFCSEIITYFKGDFFFQITINYKYMLPIAFVSSSGIDTPIKLYTEIRALSIVKFLLRRSETTYQYYCVNSYQFMIRWS